MACTAAELRERLPEACGGRQLELMAQRAEIALGDGKMLLQWRTLAPRRIALLSVPRLAVSFRFDGVDEAARQQVMRFFDLFTQRGGG